jgi:hypothetical protein
LVLRDLSNRRIDAKFEQVIEFRMEAWDVQRLAADLVPIERFQMSKIKNEPVPFRDGPRAQDARSQKPEQLVGTRSRRFDLPKQPSTHSGCSHAISG